MKVTWLPDAETRPRHVAVGEFDGVHLGHREVIAGADTVLTFEPHPRQVVAPDAAPKLLTSLDIKTDLIAGLEDDRLKPAGEQMRRGGEPDRAGADDRDALRVRVVHG